MSHTNMKCVITGVVLLDRDNGITYRGDLFESDDMWIANCNEDSRALANYSGIPEDRCILWYRAGGVTFERRGVFVFLGDNGQWGFNAFALNYMKI